MADHTEKVSGYLDEEDAATFAQIIARGDTLESYRAMRDFTAKALELTTSARDQAALMKSLQGIIATLDTWAPARPPEDAGDAADQLVEGATLDDD